MALRPGCSSPLSSYFIVESTQFAYHFRTFMELDLLDVHFDLKDIKPREIEEALEDPFAVRFLPDQDRGDGETRYYALGRTIVDRYLFLCFWSDGKNVRVVTARNLTEGERKYYDREYAEYK